MKELDVGKFKIGNDREVLIIAEIGINHEGSLEKCLDMIREAAKCGAHAIKLQTIDPDENYVKGTLSYEVFKKAFLNKEETMIAFDLSRKLGVEPFTTFGDFKTLEWAKDLSPSVFKVSSGLLSSTPIIEELASFNQTILLSTGMAEQADIDRAVSVVKDKHDNFGLFQCTSAYPCPIDSLNISFMDELRRVFNCQVGFSDHSLGVDGSLWAISRGATFIEKHFSFDKSREGFDHKISLNSQELKELCQKSKLVKSALGSGLKVINKDISEKRKFFQRCLVARKPITIGETFTRDNISIKRPLPDKRGVDPSLFYEVLGNKAQRDFNLNDPILKTDF